MTPENPLDVWHSQNPPATDFDDTVAAVREALADMEAGDAGTPFEEFDRDFRLRHGMPPRLTSAKSASASHGPQ